MKTKTLEINHSSHESEMSNKEMNACHRETKKENKFVNGLTNSLAWRHFLFNFPPRSVLPRRLAMEEFDTKINIEPRNKSVDAMSEAAES